MFKKLIFNDLKNSQLSSAAVMFFVLFSAFLLSTVGIVSTNLMGSINNLVSEAQAPHFLQMHFGEIDLDRLATFAENHENVDQYQTLEFLNIDNQNITINGEKLFDNSQDNGFSYQSQHFDFLLNMDNQVIEAQVGEIYIPLTYYVNDLMQMGDIINVGGLDFTVKGPLRDSQMNSTLSSSKRFLIHEEDYAKIRDQGKVEYLIEFLLKDTGKTAEFQGDYGKANLESNGPTITYTLIKVINSLTDGIMIGILFLICILILIISFLCIRFTLVAKIEDEYKEIGVLKGIGLRLTKIKKIYLAKYLLLVTLGVVLGYLLSVLLSRYFLDNIKVFMGESGQEGLALLVGLICSLLIFLVIVFYINQVLNRLKKISPAQAIKQGVVDSEAKGPKWFKLHQQKLLSTDAFMGISNVLNRKRLYLTFGIILIISAFIIILPNNISNTLASDEFIKYMGVGEVDIMMSIQETDPSDSKVVDLLDHLDQDPKVQAYNVQNHKNEEFLLADGKSSRMWVSSGDHTSFPVLYIEGQAPTEAHQVAISSLNATDLEKKVGDDLVFVRDGQHQPYEIVGIYSDITNGGKTGQMTQSGNTSPSLRTSINLVLADGTDAKALTEDYRHKYPDFKIALVEEFRQDVFGSTIKSVQTAALVAIILAVLLILLITLLFTRMLISKDRRNISIFKSLGFNNHSIKKQYYIGAIFLVIIGSIMGILLANTLGQTLASLFINSFGVANLEFTVNKVYAYLFAPILIAIIVYLGTRIALAEISRMTVSDYIKE